MEVGLMPEIYHLHLNLVLSSILLIIKYESFHQSCFHLSIVLLLIPIPYRLFSIITTTFIQVYFFHLSVDLLINPASI
jgi:hypothetical protein